jgi:ribosomal-protein-serine acetyltransferase
MFTHPLGTGVELAPIEPWQAAEFAAHIDEIRPHLLPWIPFASRVVDVESATAFLTWFAERQARDEGRLYVIRVDGELAGGALFRTFDVVGGVAEVGVWLAPKFEGRGLVTGAVTSMIDWAFRVRGLHRVEWRNDPANRRSRAVAKRLGMTHEGTLRSCFVLGGERHDLEVWAILADEWR